MIAPSQKKKIDWFYQDGKAYRCDELPALAQEGLEFCAAGNGYEDIDDDDLDASGQFLDGYLLARDGFLDLADGGQITLA